MMKKIIVPIAIFFVIAIISNNYATAQESCCGKKKSSCHESSKAVTKSVTVMEAAKDSIKVLGKCGMCKTRIEDAAKSVKGVNDAVWNESAKMLVYSYKETVLKQDVSDALVKVGHDTELGTASDKVYNKLHGCCQYR